MATTQTAKMSRTSIHQYSRTLSRCSVTSDFDNLVQKTMPNWSAVWHLMAQRERNKDQNLGRKFNVRGSKSDCKDLRKKIKKKVHELVSEEEVLVNLYMKAEEAAKERQEELKRKTSVLLEQIEKDKSFLKALNDTCQMV